jgi:hypothetical protein
VPGVPIVYRGPVLEVESCPAEEPPPVYDLAPVPAWLLAHAAVYGGRLPGEAALLAAGGAS